LFKMPAAAAAASGDLTRLLTAAVSGAKTGLAVVLSMRNGTPDRRQRRASLSWVASRSR
jgi:hypothetical protein